MINQREAKYATGHAIRLDSITRNENFKTNDPEISDMEAPSTLRMADSSVIPSGMVLVPGVGEPQL